MYYIDFTELEKGVQHKDIELILKEKGVSNQEELDAKHAISLYDSLYKANQVYLSNVTSYNLIIGLSVPSLVIL